MNVTEYPIEDILRTFKTEYLDNTVAFMLAYAIWAGYERIWLYGIDCLDFAACMMERGPIEFWIGVALGKGIEVMIPKESNITRFMQPTSVPGLYGEWGDRADQVKGVL